METTTTEKTPVRAMLHPGVIMADPNQPRKEFTADSIRELADSIITVGLITPISVRPTSTAGEYMLIVGERRWRACLLAELEEMEVMIWDVNDSQARQMQIVENLQRVDVHPLEEAKAIAELRENMDVADIAHQLGRSVKYVGVRLRLYSHLYKGWAALYLAGHINFQEATVLSGADIYVQEDYYAEQHERISKLAPGERMELHNVRYYMSRTQHELAKAKFDTEDPTLNPPMGKCTGCRFNTATGSLFSDVAQATCINPACYQVKDENAWRNTVREEMIAGRLFFNPNSYESEDDKRWIELAAEVGAMILKYGQYQDTWGLPDAPGTWEDFADRNRQWPLVPGMSDDYERDDEKPWTQKQITKLEDALRTGYAEEVASYPEKVKAFLEKNPEAQPAFAVCGYKRGTVVYIKPKPEVQAAMQAAVDGGLAVNDTMRIDAMRTRAARAKELDDERLWKEVTEIVRGNGTPESPRYRPTTDDGDLTDTEMEAAITTMYHIGTNTFLADDILAELGVIVDGPKTSSTGKNIIMLANLLAAPTDTKHRILNLLIRGTILTAGFPTEKSHVTGMMQSASYRFVREKYQKEVVDLEQKYLALEEKRQTSLDKRIKAVAAGTGASTAQEQEEGQDGQENS